VEPEGVSERERRENAIRKGKAAYWAGVPLEDNPMIASDSRHAWREAWKAEKELAEAGKAGLKRVVEEGAQWPEHGYYLDLDVDWDEEDG
jgi:hypothetical protein